MNRRDTAKLSESIMVRLAHALADMDVRACLVLWPEEGPGEGSMSSLVPAATQRSAHEEAAKAIAYQLVFCCKHLGMDPHQLLDEAAAWRPKEEGN